MKLLTRKDDFTYLDKNIDNFFGVGVIIIIIDSNYYIVLL